METPSTRDPADTLPPLPPLPPLPAPPPAKTGVTRLAGLWTRLPPRHRRPVRLATVFTGCIIIAIIFFRLGWLAAKSKYRTAGKVENGEEGAEETSEASGPCTGPTSDPGGDCSRYLACEAGLARPARCPRHQHFSVTTGRCEFIHLAGCGGATPSSIPASAPGAPPDLAAALAAEAQLTGGARAGRLKARLVTRDSGEVEAVVPSRAANPPNVRLLERVLPESAWKFLFPRRNPAYSYTALLQAAAKFPALCHPDSEATCRKVLATMFAHFAQETGEHNPSSTVPQWRQGLHHVEEVGCGERDCGYSTNCGSGQWTARAWPCGKDSKGGYLSYHGRGAKQLSYNYNYAQFSAAMFGDPRVLLDNPDKVRDTWLNLASAIWFFATPQPPKPSMLGVVEGDWRANADDTASGLSAGFGLTTNIINGGIECGKGAETAQARNRAQYYTHFARYLQVEVDGELGCGKMKPFGERGAGAVPTYWEQDWTNKYRCKLVSYQTPYSMFIPRDYVRCVEAKFKLKLL